MSTFVVYHAEKPTFGFGEQPKFPEDYIKVAAVDCKGLEDVFRATNHIDEDWTSNPEVRWLNPRMQGRFRSTSVGDVVQDEDAKFHYCDHVGWKELEVSNV